MKINGTELYEFGKGIYRVKQWRVTRGTRTLKNNTVWERGSPIPIFQTPTATLKTLTVVLMVHSFNRDAIENGMSDIMAALTGINELELDRHYHQFCGVLAKATMSELSETSRNRFQELSLQFSGYEHGERESVTVSGTSITIDNPGNMISPASIELTPSSAISSLTITGLCRDSETGTDLEVTVSNMTSGSTVTLDGIDGLITENGELKADDVDMWALPTLLPGENTITFSTSLDAEITVLPIYM